VSSCCESARKWRHSLSRTQHSLGLQVVACTRCTNEDTVCPDHSTLSDYKLWPVLGAQINEYFLIYKPLFTCTSWFISQTDWFFRRLFWADVGPRILSNVQILIPMTDQPQRGRLSLEASNKPVWYTHIFNCECMWCLGRAGRSGDRILVGSEVFRVVQAGATSTMATGSFPGIKRPGRGADHPLCSSAALRTDRNYRLSSVLSACCGTLWGAPLFLWHSSPQWTRACSLSRLHDHTQTHRTR